MKLLVFSDVHGDLKVIDSIKKKSTKADILVCAGDLTIFENKLLEMLSYLDKTNKTVLIIPGNHESPKNLEKFSKKFKNIRYIHKKSFIFKDVLFIGYGGGGFSVEDPEFKKSEKRLESKLIEDKDTVLITHEAPYGTKVDLLGDEHCGSKPLRSFIKKHREIKVLICGHFHENKGIKDKIGNTLIINPKMYGEIIKFKEG